MAKQAIATERLATSPVFDPIGSSPIDYFCSFYRFANS